MTVVSTSFQLYFDFCFAYSVLTLFQFSTSFFGATLCCLFVSQSPPYVTTNVPSALTYLARSTTCFVMEFHSKWSGN